MAKVLRPGRFLLWNRLWSILKIMLWFFIRTKVSTLCSICFMSSETDKKKRMCEDNARRLIKAYGSSTKEICSEVPDNVHPHLFRHSRSMHLYQKGMDLTLLSQWLGHAQIETTLIYAHADTELKRKAIESATDSSSPLKAKLNSERYIINDEEMLKRLYGLR